MILGENCVMFLVICCSQMDLSPKSWCLFLFFCVIVCCSQMDVIPKYCFCLKICFVPKWI